LTATHIAKASAIIQTKINNIKNQQKPQKTPAEKQQPAA
jgi:hypothetical protein